MRVRTKKIKERKYIIDQRHPRTFFCDFIGENNKDQKIFDLFINKLFNSNEIKTKEWKDLIEWNKETALNFDRSFIKHDFSKVIKLDMYRDNIKTKPEIKNDLIIAIIKQIKKLLIEQFLTENHLNFNDCKLPQSIDVYYSVMAYYHFFSATEGRPKRNDFTDINYMLYLDKGRQFYTLDKKLFNALKTVKPELIYFT